MKYISCLMLAALFAAPLQAAGVKELLSEYQVGAGRPFSAEAGKQAWLREVPAPNGGAARSCASCHTADPGGTGRHLRTSKTIEPMSPRVNPRRLTDKAKIEKWFKRNCRWTWGRDCTPQERGDLLLFIQS
ncbi:MAG: DUF1924 domain-containing protein [Gammaproteobacteria bacterium]|nr:DUF1924 domain-containing protein [Gammaproteobacteria bacterium]